MQYPRHGHSACSVGRKFIVVTGSKKRNKNAQVKCEKYDCDTNKWSTMQDLNIGRFYHASCAFSG